MLCFVQNSTTKESKTNRKNVEYDRFVCQAWVVIIFLLFFLYISHFLILMRFYLKRVKHLNFVVAMLHQKMFKVTTKAWHTNRSYSSCFNVGVDFDIKNPISLVLCDLIWTPVLRCQTGDLITEIEISLFFLSSIPLCF